MYGNLREFNLSD